MFDTLNQFEYEVKKLVTTSHKNSYKPFERMLYPEKLNLDRFQFPEAYLSIYHHPIYSELTDEQKWKLSLLEAVNFFSLNIQGEQALVRGLSSRLYKNKYRWDSPSASEYLQHFIHEENAHTFMLAGYCVKYYGQLMSDLINMRSEEPQMSAIVEDLLFYSRTAILEYFLGFLNRKAKSDDSLDPIVKQIHYFHYFDETRHIAFDRLVIEETLKTARENGLHDEIQIVARLLHEYVQYSIKRLYNFRVYRVIGLPNPFQIYQEAQKLEKRHFVESEWLSQGNQLLQKLGFQSTNTNALSDVT